MEEWKTKDKECVGEMPQRVLQGTPRRTPRKMIRRTPQRMLREMARRMPTGF